MLSHNDATAFCQWLSTKENRQYRLPTAHEWTAANQLGAVRLRFDTDPNEPYRTWFDASEPNPLGIRNATEIPGEWTSNSEWLLSRSVTVIVNERHQQRRQAIRPQPPIACPSGISFVRDLFPRGCGTADTDNACRPTETVTRSIGRNCRKSAWRSSIPSDLQKMTFRTGIACPGLPNRE